MSFSPAALLTTVNPARQSCAARPPPLPPSRSNATTEQSQTFPTPQNSPRTSNRHREGRRDGRTGRQGRSRYGCWGLLCEEGLISKLI